MSPTRITVALLTPALAALAIAGCGGDTESSPAPSGSPTSAGPTPGMDPRAPKCRYFDSQAGSNEFTTAKGDDNDGVMGKLINETRATVWVRYTPRFNLSGEKAKECRMTAGSFVLFSRNGSTRFFFRNREREDDLEPWQFATQIFLFDPYDAQALAAGGFNTMFDDDNAPWRQFLSEDEIGTFNWGSVKVEVKRDQDNTFDSIFRSKGYMTSEMSDWAHYTVRIKSL